MFDGLLPFPSPPTSGSWTLGGVPASGECSRGRDPRSDVVGAQGDRLRGTDDERGRLKGPHEQAGGLPSLEGPCGSRTGSHASSVRINPEQCPRYGYPSGGRPAAVATTFPESPSIPPRGSARVAGRCSLARASGAPCFRARAGRHGIHPEARPGTRGDPERKDLRSGDAGTHGPRTSRSSHHAGRSFRCRDGGDRGRGLPSARSTPALTRSSRSRCRPGPRCGSRFGANGRRVLVGPRSSSAVDEPTFSHDGSSAR